MKQTNVKIPGLILHDIESQIKKGNFKDTSDFIRQAAKYLLSDLKTHPNITMKLLEDLKK